MTEPPPGPRVLVCPQEFKGTLDPERAARAIAAGVRAALPAATITVQPMSDGGPGTAGLLARALDGTEVHCPAHDPLGRPLPAAYVRVDRPQAGPGGAPGWTAIVESARTAGLGLLDPGERDPARATSRGVGDQIAHAVAHGATEMIVGIGGTATNDGGAGALVALGYRLLDGAGVPLPDGAAALARLERIDDGAVPQALRRCRLRVAADVSNPLTGVDGATFTYGPQKYPPGGDGGDQHDRLLSLEAALLHWAQVVERELGVSVRALPGAGAGGGLACGLAATAPRTGATIEPGAALVAEAIGLRAHIAGADLVITGEGRLDAQTGFGKAVRHVSALATEAGVPCLAVAGRIERLPPGIADAEATGEGPPPLPLPDGPAAERAVTAATVRLLRRTAPAAPEHRRRPG